MYVINSAHNRYISLNIWAASAPCSSKSYYSTHLTPKITRQSHFPLLIHLCSVFNHTHYTPPQRTICYTLFQMQLFHENHLTECGSPVENNINRLFVYYYFSGSSKMGTVWLLLIGKPKFSHYYVLFCFWTTRIHTNYQDFCHCH